MKLPKLPSLLELAWLKDAKGYADRCTSARERSGTPAVLLPEPAKRQLATVLEIMRRLKQKQPLQSAGSGPRGVLLADDVGLGKTVVGAVLAGLFAGSGFAVRILAPNRTMTRRWLEEIRSHQDVLGEIGYRFDVSDRVRRLTGRKVAISTIVRGTNSRRLACDLPIIDEAHRAKNEKGRFAVEFRRQREDIRWVLALTATPFSIAPKELGRMLRMVGADGSVSAAIEKASASLETLWSGRFTDPAFGEQLVQDCRSAIDAMHPFVIRHGVSALPEAERRRFGVVEPADLVSMNATPSQMEILARGDRLLALGRRTSAWGKSRTNDPRHHVGWQQLKKDVKEVREHARHSRNADPILDHHASALGRLLGKEGPHPKMVATGQEVLRILASGERVVLFCDHHETAGELALHLSRLIRQRLPLRKAPRMAWREIYRQACQLHAEGRKQADAREGFLKWLGSDGIAAQVFSWLPPGRPTEKGVVAGLKRTHPRSAHWGRATGASIARHIDDLWTRIRQSSSSSSVFREYERDVFGSTLDAQRIVAVTSPPEKMERWQRAVFHGGSPDTVISVFNSPIGPDALVVTDAFSEGYDLHRYCRHLIHYELDPSPMRTIQRNGRLRRVGCWSAVTEKPLVIGYPVFNGTRDERAVEIMKNRLAQFDLLLGGVGSDVYKEASDGESMLRQAEVLRVARARLARYAGRLSVVKA